MLVTHNQSYIGLEKLSQRRKMLKLYCAIVGAAVDTLSVNIAADQSVEELKEAIQKKIPATITCELQSLLLFLAKKENKWLSDDETLGAMLLGGFDSSSFLRMRASWALNKAELFGPRVSLGEGVVHVLVVVPKQDQQLRCASARDSFSLFREDRLRQVRLETIVEQKLVALLHKEPSYTDGALGERESQRLAKEGLIVDVAPMDHGEGFWSREIQSRADEFTNEAEFDAFITPFFSKILEDCGMVFVNCDGYPWPSPSTCAAKRSEFKPVGFATHRGMFRAKPEPSDGVRRPDGFRFGVPEEGLLDCLILFERHRTITDAAFGQVVRNLRQLSPDAPASVILLDRHNFWMIKSHKSVVVKVQRAAWADKGSKAVFRGFIAGNISPWVTRLTIACSALGVDVVEGDAFLGRGAFGRVFKVTGQDGEVLALKLVEIRSAGRLSLEKQALENAQGTGLTIRPVGELVEILDSAMLLLSPVGIPLPRPTTRKQVRDLFGLLWQLHDKDLIHGDPRVPNVILSGEKPLWIDLVEAIDANPALKQLDAEILTRSVLGVSRTLPLDPVLQQLMDNYGQSDTQTNLSRLAEEVGQSLGFSVSLGD